MAKKKDSEAAAEAGGGKLTQREAVRRALAAGKDSPAEGVVFLKEEFGITLNNQAFSTLKSQLKKAEGGTAGRGRRGAAHGRTDPHAVELARAVKLLVTRYGAQAVADMATIFAE